MKTYAIRSSATRFLKTIGEKALAAADTLIKQNITTTGTVFEVDDVRAREIQDAGVETVPLAMVAEEPNLAVPEEVKQAIQPSPEQKAADEKANAALTGINIKRSSEGERPCKRVFHIADSMPGAKRSEVIEECVNQGVAFYTARTQYQEWFKTQKEMAQRIAQQATKK